MKNFTLSKKLSAVCFLFFILIGSTIFAQVGIGTVTPDASSILDISSTTQGMLAPRLTTAQRIAIASPADGLVVYDTDIKAFHYYSSASSGWIKMFGDTDGRLKFKRIRSTDVLAKVLATEKAAGGGSKYLLDTNTLYEINGTVFLDFPIELNNSCLMGQDHAQDKLIKATGDIIVGTTGGSIKMLTLAATLGKVFDIKGGGTQNLIFRDAIVAGSSNVGLIDNFNLVFFSIIQYVGNIEGIVYKDINKLLISNVGWFGDNSGTYEKLQGTFGLVEKQGGFSEVGGTSIGFDVSANPTITGDAVIESVVFTGSNTSRYVKAYANGTYPGYNFNGSWSVRSTGIPNEGDSFTTGNLYLDRTVTLPTISFTDTSSAYKVPGTTISTNLFRMDGATNNRLVYSGRKSRTFTVSASVSFEGGTGSADLLFYFVKFASGGTPYTFITSSETFIDSNTANVQSFPITGTITLTSGEYVELYARRLNGTNKTFTFRSYNMSIK